MEESAIIPPFLSKARRGNQIYTFAFNEQR